MPRVMKMPPAKRRDGSPKKADWNRQWEIHQGTNPATKPGAMTRKTAEPAIAATFLITCLGVVGPWWSPGIKTGRDGGIRTRDPLTPSQVR